MKRRGNGLVGGGVLVYRLCIQDLRSGEIDVVSEGESEEVGSREGAGAGEEELSIYPGEGVDEFDGRKIATRGGKVNGRKSSRTERIDDRNRS
jgi:hypothetical protein